MGGSGEAGPTRKTEREAKKEEAINQHPSHLSRPLSVSLTGSALSLYLSIYISTD